MPFEKPCKAFICYSHHPEDRALCGEFVEQLKSLEKDKILKIWYDGHITAGQEWDPSIREKLETADLFIPLTSAAFNSSEYIDSIEMKRAEERYAEGKCRIIPVMLRPWHPPERFRKFQFPLDTKIAVSNAPNRDDVMRQIVEKIEAAVDEMTERDWRPEAATRMQAIEAPKDLPYLCDWAGPLRDVESALRVQADSSSVPCVIVLVSTVADCPEAFLERMRSYHFAKALGLDGKWISGPIPLEWPSSPGKTEEFDDLVHAALDRPRNLPLDRKLREGITVLRVAEDGDAWSRDRSRLLAAFLTYWRDDLWKLPGMRGLVSVVLVELSKRNDKTVKLIKRIVQENQHERVRAAVIEIPEVGRVHAASWASDPKVKKYYQPHFEQDLADAIRDLYIETAKPLPMRTLAPKLREFIQRYQ